MAKRRIIPYNPKLLSKARQLRKAGTHSEALLWTKLKNKQLCGLRFLRQRPIDEYIVDFFCPEMSLVIELDGITHENKESYDLRRQKRLEALGLHVLRFLDSDVKDNIDGVLQYLVEWIERNRG